MATALRRIGSILTGMLVAFILIVAVEFFSAVVHPLPSDFTGTMDEMCQHVERYPHWVLAVVVFAWGGTALASTWTAGRLGSRGCALFVGLLLLTAVIFNVSKLPYPTWFKIANVIVIPSAIVAALYLLRRREAAAVNILGA